MKNVEIDEKIKADPELAPAVKDATILLDAELGASADLVTARWNLSEDARSRPVIDLEISDFTGAVSTRFAPDELRNTSHMQVRLGRLWGDLLQVRSHKQVEKLRQLVREQGDN